jgi:hypothetical protein
VNITDVALLSLQVQQRSGKVIVGAEQHVAVPRRITVAGTVYQLDEVEVLKARRETVWAHYSRVHLGVFDHEARASSANAQLCSAAWRVRRCCTTRKRATRAHAASPSTRGRRLTSGTQRSSLTWALNAIFDQQQLRVLYGCGLPVDGSLQDAGAGPGLDRSQILVRQGKGNQPGGNVRRVTAGRLRQQVERVRAHTLSSGRAVAIASRRAALEGPSDSVHRLIDCGEPGVLVRNE